MPNNSPHISISCSLFGILAISMCRHFWYTLFVVTWHWGYSNEPETCDCDIRQTMKLLLVCPMTDTACSTRNLSKASCIATGCARHCEGTIWHWHATGGRARINDNIALFRIRRATICLLYSWKTYNPYEVGLTLLLHASQGHFRFYAGIRHVLIDF